jgi:hypothetical protein
VVQIRSSYNSLHKTNSFDLVNLGVGTTADVFDVSIEILDKKGKVIGRGSKKNFQISCK